MRESSACQALESLGEGDLFFQVNLVNLYELKQLMVLDELHEHDVYHCRAVLGLVLLGRLLAKEGLRQLPHCHLGPVYLFSIDFLPVYEPYVLQVDHAALDDVQVFKDISIVLIQLDLKIMKIREKQNR